MSHFLLVMGGGALGAASRYGLGLLLPKPGWSTSLVNILGSFLAVWIVSQFSKNQPAALFALTGFCGAFTTYSTFSLETMNMLHSREHSMTGICAYVLVNLLGSLIAAFVAWKLFMSQHA